MKKVVVSLVFAGILLGSAPLDAAVSKMRAVKCAIPRLHAKFNCTDEEKVVGRKWLKAATIAAAVAALAALVAGGVKYAEVQAEKKRLAEQEARSKQREEQLQGRSRRIEAAGSSALKDQVAKIEANPELIYDAYKANPEIIEHIDLSQIFPLDIKRLLSVEPVISSGSSSGSSRRRGGLSRPKDYKQLIVTNYLKLSSNAVIKKRKLRAHADAIFAIEGLPARIYAIAVQQGKLAEPSTSQLQKQYEQKIEAEIAQEGERLRAEIEREKAEDLAILQDQLRELQRAAGAEGKSGPGQEGSSSPSDAPAAQALIADYRRRVSPLAQELVTLVEMLEKIGYNQGSFYSWVDNNSSKLQEIKAMIERMSIEQSLKGKMLQDIEVKIQQKLKERQRVPRYA